MISLRPGASPQLAVQNLRAAANAAHNATGTGKIGFHMMTAFIEWANAQAINLRPLISDHDLNHLVLTTEYWTLRGNAPADYLGGFTMSLINELLRCEANLKAAADGVEAEIARWKYPVANETLAVTLDTNVLLQYSSKLLTARWHKIVKRPSGVTYIFLIVTRAAIDELDTKKMSRDKTPQGELVRSQAHVAIRKLEKMFAPFAAPGTFGPQYPEVAEFSGRFELLSDDLEHVQRPDTDGEIIDRARTVAPFVDHSMMLTYDLGMALRSRAAGLEAIRLEYPEASSNAATAAPFAPKSGT